MGKNHPPWVHPVDTLCVKGPHCALALSWSGKWVMNPCLPLPRPPFSAPLFLGSLLEHEFREDTKHFPGDLGEGSWEAGGQGGRGVFIF